MHGLEGRTSVGQVVWCDAARDILALTLSADADADAGCDSDLGTEEVGVGSIISIILWWVQVDNERTWFWWVTGEKNGEDWTERT